MHPVGTRREREGWIGVRSWVAGLRMGRSSQLRAGRGPAGPVERVPREGGRSPP